MALTPEKRKILEQMLAPRLGNVQGGMPGLSALPTGGATPKQTGFQPSALISEALGTVGGVGGFLLGGPVGAAGGAALLGGLGSALEQKVRDNKVDAGKSVREGLLEGLFAGGPLRLAKAGLIGAKGVSKAAAGKATRQDVIGQLSESLRPSRAGQGILRNSTIAGRSTLDSATDQANLIDLAAKFPELRGSAAKKFQNVEKVIGKLGGQVDDLLKGVPNTVPASRLADTAMEYAQGLAKTDRTAFVREYGRIVKQAFGNKKMSELSASEVMKFRRIVNSKATRAFRNLEKGVPLSSIDYGVLELRDMSDDLLEAVAPSAVLKDIKQVNNQISSLIRGQAEWKKLSEDIPSIFGNTLPIVSPALSRGVQATADAAGRGVRQLAGGGVLPQAARVGTGSALANAGGATATTAPTNQVDMLSSGLAGGGAGMQQPQAQGGLTEEDINQAIMIDLQETGGKNVEQIQMLAQLYGPQAYGQKPLSAEASKVVANANSGLEALANFEQIITENPEKLKATAVPGRGVVGGLGNRVLGISDLEANKQLVIDAWARLKTGAAISKDEEKRFNDNLPTAFDTSQAIRTKLNNIRNMFMAVANRTGSAGSDLQAAAGS